MATQPWAAGPKEILEHGISLLRKDSDKNRRLALLSVDNAVELIIKTYLAVLVKVSCGATPLQLSREQMNTRICDRAIDLTGDRPDYMVFRDADL